MAYSDFTSLELVEQQLGISNRVEELFANVEPIEPSDWLRNALQTASELPLKSEKAKSEWIVAPVLTEFRNRNKQFITVFSGEMLNVDEQKGLKGECDFIVAKDTGSLSLSRPIMHIIEAKKGDLEIGIPQCTAQMVGARLFNLGKNTLSNDTVGNSSQESFKEPFKEQCVYGCVTTGRDWLFLQLRGNAVIIDRTTYYLPDIASILGVFQAIASRYR